MDTFGKEILWGQLGGALDMLENAMRACPEELWCDDSKSPQWDERGVVGFWYLVYHTLFFLDFYLSGSEKDFAPPAPFTLAELDPAGLLPERPFRKNELETYLEHCRRRCRQVIAGLTEETARRRCGFERLDISVAELLLYNLRHVQHHTAQLHLLLRQAGGEPPRWVARTRSDLGAE